MNDIIKSLYNRKSVRAYTGETFPENLIKQIEEVFRYRYGA